MAKKREHDTHSEPRQPAPAPAGQAADRASFVELKPGLFLNLQHVVSVRVLAQEEDNVYAVLQLSSGEKQNLSREEFTAITGEDPRPPARLPRKPSVR